MFYLFSNTEECGRLSGVCCQVLIMLKSAISPLENGRITLPSARRVLGREYSEEALFGYTEYLDVDGIGG